MFFSFHSISFELILFNLILSILLFYAVINGIFLISLALLLLAELCYMPEPQSIIMLSKSPLLMDF